MKRTLFLLALALAALLTLSLTACNGGDGDATTAIPAGSTGLEFREESDGYYVYGYNGTDTEVVIPSQYKGRPVVGLNEGAFDDNLSITAITVPDTVKSIGRAAFQECTGLRSVHLSEGLKSIEEFAFDRCTSLVDLTLPASLETVGNLAFRDTPRLILRARHGSKPAGFAADWADGNPCVWDCSRNEMADDGAVYTEIDGIRYALADGKATVTRQERDIPSVTIPATVESIGKEAFHGCNLLASLTFAEGSCCRSIGEMAFGFCRALPSVTIPVSMTSFGVNAFEGCTTLREVHIGDMAAWCTASYGNSAANPLFCGADLYLNGGKIVEAVIPDGVTSLGANLFPTQSSIASVVVPASVTRIAAGALPYDCMTVYMKHDTPPTGWTESFALRDCPVIWNYPESLVATDGNIYVTEGGLRYVVKNGNAIVIEPPRGIRAAHIVAEVACGGTSYPVTAIAERAFQSYASLESVTFAEGSRCTSIGDYAFCECTSLRSIAIPASVQTVKQYAFYGCTALTSVTFGEGSNCSSFGTQAFYKCSSLCELTVPKTVVSIGKGALTTFGASYFTFEDTANWYRTKGTQPSDGTPVDVSNPYKNRDIFSSTGDYFYKK